MASALERLKAAYRDRLGPARAAAGQGRPVVGIVGQAPVEPILAAGAVPVSITADRARPTPTAHHYIDDVVSPDVRALFEAGVAGDFAFLDLLVISRSNDKLYYYLKEIHRQGRAPGLPKLHIFDLMPSQRPQVAAYNRGRYAALVEAVERAVGPVDAAAMAKAVETTNRIRGLQRRLQEQRWRGTVPGSEAIEVIGAGAYMDRAEYAELLAAYVAEAEGKAAPEGVKRVLVSGSEPFVYSDFHAAVEAAGANVVAEDDVWGARAAGEGDIATSGDLGEAVLTKAWNDTADPDRYPRSARQEWFEKTVTRPEVDLVIFHIPPSDHRFGWDYPRLKAVAEAAGKPTLLLRKDASNAAAGADVAPVLRAQLAEIGTVAA